LTLLPPGDYRLEVDAKGFSKQVLDNVRGPDRETNRDQRWFERGRVSETVEVSISAQAALINTQDASLGNNFESSQITQLPLEGRNVVDLLSLQP